MEIDLTRQLGRREVTLELGQQPLSATLIEVEGTLAELVGHRKGKVGGTDAHRQVGHPLLSLGDDTLPITDTHQVVVLYQLVFPLVEAIQLRH